MSFWENKNVLITGSTGFVGSNLYLALAGKGANVVSFSSDDLSNSRLIRNTQIKKIKTHIVGSVLDIDLLIGVIKKNKIKFIYHLAAQPLVELGKESPTKTFDINIKGTWNVLEAARVSSVEKIIVASTSHVYGDNPNPPYTEENFPQPSRPYETSKACADLLAQSYADTYFLPVEIPRFVNLYGRGDFNFSRIIPKVINSILEGKSPEVWDVGIMRDFLYIDDAINAYLLLVEKNLPNNKRSRIFNFGSCNPIKIVDLVKKIIEISGRNLGVKILPMPTNRDKEITKQYVSIEKAKKVLGWTPKTTLDEGLRKTLSWYERYFKSN